MLLRVATERLLLALFTIVRIVFLLQGLAMTTSLLAVPLVAQDDAPRWLQVAVRSSVALGAVLVAAGVLLFAARRVAWPRGDDAQPARPATGMPSAKPAADARWPWMLALSLVALPLIAGAGAGDLSILWTEISARLDAIGFWDEMSRPGPFSGIVLLPIYIALLVPALETAAAFFLIVIPLLMLPLLATRSRILPRLFAMMVVCQAAFVAAGFLAAEAFSSIGADAIAAMVAAPDAEVHVQAQALDRSRTILLSVSRELIAPMLAYLAWCVFLLTSPSAGAYFTEDDGEPARTGAAGLAGRGVASAPGATLDTLSIPRRASWSGKALAVLGAFLMAFSAAELLRTRASFVSSSPVAGARLASSPASVSVGFDEPLHGASSLSVTRLPATPADGSAVVVVPKAGLDRGDREHKTLATSLPRTTSDGIYHVAWTAIPGSGGVTRHGSLQFGVRADVPAATAAVEERDSGERGRRRTFAGGALLLLIGAATPWLRRGR